jgi:hypothetical protein
MLTLNQQKQVIDHLDKARLLLQASSDNFEYRVTEHLISRIMASIQKFKIKETE